MARYYHFLTGIRLTSPPQVVWDTLAETGEWPSWWPWLRAVEVLGEGDSSGVGRRVRNRVVTPLGYRLTYEGVVVRSDRPGYLELQVSGDLKGTGRFHLSPQETGSHISFHWIVRTSKLWMRLVGPLGRPVFAWSHRVVMTDFAEGLARTTGAELITVDNRALPRR